MRGFVVICGLLLLPDITFAAFENPVLFLLIARLLEAFVKGVIFVGTPALAAFLVWAGFLFTLARGNPEALTRAKKMFVKIVLLGTLLLGLWVLSSYVGDTLAGLSAQAVLAVITVIAVWFMFVK